MSDRKAGSVAASEEFATQTMIAKPSQVPLVVLAGGEGGNGAREEEGDGVGEGTGTGLARGEGVGGEGGGGEGGGGEGGGAEGGRKVATTAGGGGEGGARPRPRDGPLLGSNTLTGQLPAVQGTRKVFL